MNVKFYSFGLQANTMKEWILFQTIVRVVLICAFAQNTKIHIIVRIRFVEKNKIKMRGVMNDNPEELKELLIYPWHVLNTACEFGAIKCVKWLCGQYDLPDKTIALRNAVISDREEIVALLLTYKNQFDINYIDIYGHFILWYALDNIRILKMLVEAGATFSHRIVVFSSGHEKALIILMQHNRVYIYQNSPQWIWNLNIRVLKSKRACVSATIALLQILRINRVPKDLARHIAQSFFTKNKLGEGWL